MTDEQRNFEQNANCCDAKKRDKKPSTASPLWRQRNKKMFRLNYISTLFTFYDCNVTRKQSISDRRPNQIRTQRVQQQQKGKTLCNFWWQFNGQIVEQTFSFIRHHVIGDDDDLVGFGLREICAKIKSFQFQICKIHYEVNRKVSVKQMKVLFIQPPSVLIVSFSLDNHANAIVHWSYTRAQSTHDWFLLPYSTSSSK